MFRILFGQTQPLLKPTLIEKIEEKGLTPDDIWHYYIAIEDGFEQITKLTYAAEGGFTICSEGKCIDLRRYKTITVSGTKYIVYRIKPFGWGPDITTNLVYYLGAILDNVSKPGAYSIGYKFIVLTYEDIKKY